MNAIPFKINHATKSARRLGDSRLIAIDTKTSGVFHEYVSDLPKHFKEGDVLVVNDAGTLPSSLQGTHRSSKRNVEIRLCKFIKENEYTQFQAVLLGPGDWHTPTEKRMPPPDVILGDTLDFSNGLSARIMKIHSAISKQLIDIHFDGQNPLAKIYKAGLPTQYSYLQENLELWDHQTIFSSQPVAFEPPSASFVLTWDLMFQLQARGVEILKVTHGTGLSNSGVKAIDRQLPFSEPFHISQDVQEKLSQALYEKRRIIAVGTGVVRALETWAGKKTNGDWAWSTLKLSKNFRLKVVSGLLTGFHEPEGSHLSLLEAFVDKQELQRIYSEASVQGYLWHEYGDVCLIMTEKTGYP